MAKKIDAYITAFQTRKWLSDSTKHMYHKAVQLLESFRRGELKTNEVFDVHKLATFLALTDLMGAHHNAAWSSLRLYYNPITSRLEPIGFGRELPSISVFGVFSGVPTPKQGLLSLR